MLELTSSWLCCADVTGFVVVAGILHSGPYGGGPCLVVQVAAPALDLQSQACVQALGHPAILVPLGLFIFKGTV